MVKLNEKIKNVLEACEIKEFKIDTENSVSFNGVYLVYNTYNEAFIIVDKEEDEILNFSENEEEAIEMVNKYK